MLSKISREGDCWIYTGARNGRGDYGRMRAPIEIAEAMGCPAGWVQAHRLSYWLHVGPFDVKLVIHHLCHTKLCVNPEHLTPTDVNTNAVEANDTRWAEVAYDGEEWL